MDFVNEILGKDYFFHHSRHDIPETNVFKLHTHDAFEIYLFINGDAIINIEDRFFKLEPFDLFFIHPGRFHRVILNSGNPYERKVIRFEYSFIRSVDPDDLLINMLTNLSVIRNKDLKSANIHHTYERINEIFDYKEKIREIAVKGIIIELLIKISESENSVGLAESENPNDKKVSEIIDFINENLSSNLSLDVISKKFFISKYYLSRIFKENIGSSLGDFILKKRLIYAKRLIVGGTTPMSASFQSGFTDYSSFYKSYKKYFGFSPSATTK